MKIIVTIPAFNEENTIGIVINEVIKTFSDTTFNYEIQVLNDGSTDKTEGIARSLGATVYSHPRNYGLAETFRDEIEFALQNGADIIVHIDADGQYQTDEIISLIEPIINNEADFVMGSRFRGTIEEMPLLKKLGNKAFSRVVSQICRIQISDAQTGFRAFTREVAEKVKVKSNFTYTQEQIIECVKNKFRIKEVPIFFAKRISGSSRLMTNPIDYAIKAGINMFRIYRDFAPLKFFGFIGVTLIAIAFLLFLFSIFIFKNFYDVTVILLSLSGLQIILFGFLAEMNQE